MHYFVQFYRLRNGAYQEALASDGVLSLDGRWSRAHMEREAARVCAVRGMDGWRLARSTHHYSNPFYLTAAVRGR